MSCLTSSGKTARFSLYCLEESEEYIEDARCEYYPPSPNYPNLPVTSRTQLHGRARLCSSSFFFEPDDVAQPITKFPFRNFSGRIFVSSGSSSQNLFAFQCPTAVHMMESGVVRPHVTIEAPGQHMFTLTFANRDEFVSKIDELHRIARLDPQERAFQLQELLQRREAQYSFDYTWLNDVKEVVRFEHVVYRVIPLVRIRGRIVVTDTTIYFQAFNNIDALPVIRIPFTAVERMERRRHMLQDLALEVQTRTDGFVLYIALNLGRTSSARPCSTRSSAPRA
eukprot:TRINITY_DN489_c0_g1_i1.p1 TRINITY_DN489_c0_g1~~TRINITY_DN489_c0_g1_i1.p1  ORF type:complete len:281 (+),score=25.54 TRINITY_DN489_c0_g1_i1:55-897(+)